MEMRQTIFIKLILRPDFLLNPFFACAILFFLTVVNSSCIAASAGKTVNHDIVLLSKQDNGKTITVKLGTIVQIELERYGGTGYEWYLDDSYKEHFVLIKEEKHETIKDNFVGTPVLVRWQLNEVRQGDAELKIFLYRHWEGKDKAASSFEVKVKIH
jgi:inhibitor of cysteine peptidase